MEQLKKIRNFVIISHIDHGKSTLADRLLELTGTIEKGKHAEQYLDLMELERERGITIKMQPVRMIYHTEIQNPNIRTRNKSKIQNPKSQTGFGSHTLDLGFSNSEFILNLIDTPGHMDFGYEVERSLAAVEGAILLVDATQGVQAQTLANLKLAREQNLHIIGAVNKIDLPSANIPAAIEELAKLLSQQPHEVLTISAKNGTGVNELLEAIIKRVPPPRPQKGTPKALIFDSHFDPYKGVIAYIRVISGVFTRQQSTCLFHANTQHKTIEVGVFTPQPKPVSSLAEGLIGYIATGIKEPGRVKVGDTIFALNEKLEVGLDNEKPLPGYREPQPVIFANFFPSMDAEFPVLTKALEELHLNDAALYYEPTGHPAFGRGYRIGLLGMLHLEITLERLEREFSLAPIVTSPSVAYRIENKTTHQQKPIHSPTELTNEAHYNIKEPWVSLEIVSPARYLGKLMRLMENYRGIYKDTAYLTRDHIKLSYEAPLADIIVDLIDTLKSSTEGYASMSYVIIDWRASDLVKLEYLIANEVKEAFSQIVPRAQAFTIAKRFLVKLKEVLPKQNFAQKLQARVGGRIIARETISALRKDVIAPLYGGDYTRKKKLLVKQRKGKKKLASRGRVHIPAEVYLKALKR